MKPTILHILFLAACCMSIMGCSKSSSATSEEDRKIDSLMSLMTLEEKVGQLAQYNGGWINDEVGERVRQGLVGSMLNSADPEEIRYYQRIAVEETRLGIPLIFARDIIHGFHTIYPIPLGQGATWNPALVEEAAKQTALEATQTGIRWTFSPMVDVARDPRWGRIAEGYGEDTYLTGVMGAATVRGYQGEDMQAPNTLAACVKHFAGYGASEGGRDYNETDIPEVKLRETYLPPFKACADEGAASFMCSFNAISGIPSSANKHLNVEILRNEWGYDGLMCSDWASSENMVAHGNAEDWKDATVQSIHARIEVDMPGVGYVKYVKELLDEKKITMEEVDVCVRSVLRMKFRLGLFDNPYACIPEGEPSFYTEAALKAAREACEESAILLKNNGVLPLKASDRIYLCGPLMDAQHDQNGTWCFDAIDSMTVTPLMAFRDMAAQGEVNFTAQQGKHWSREISADNIASLRKDAAGAGVVVFFAGEESILSGEARCRAHLNLPGDQTEQIAALKAMGKKVVVVVMAGRPLCIGKELEMADAVLYAYHGGTMQGPALANLLMGKAVPSGKTTTTFPQAEGQIPFYYNRTNTGRPSVNPVLIDSIKVGAGQFSIGESSYWLEYGIQPLVPFGFGLSYTTFEYGALSISDSTLTADSSIKVSATISNTGAYAGKEAVQLYIRDMVGSIARPLKELKGFEKISLNPGESKTVEFEITPQMLAYWHFADDVTPGADGRYELSAEKGRFLVWIAPNSADLGEGKMIELK